MNTGIFDPHPHLADARRPKVRDPAGRGRRVLFYSHDTYGLGHIRRTLCLVQALLEEAPRTEVLLATGSPVLEKLSIPAGIRILPLKPVVKTAAETYEARDGSMGRREVIAHRSAQLEGAARFFQPDVAVVDHAPLGMKGELLAALEVLRGSTPRTRTILGLRDILDEPEVVRRLWRAQRVYDTLERHYDRILVYGERRHFAVDSEYALPESVCAKLVFTGYLRKSEPLTPGEQIRRELRIPADAPMLLATVGGGGDGAEVLSATIAAVPLLQRDRPRLRALFVTGPLMDEASRHRLEADANGIAGATITAFVPNLTSAMAAADVVVGMAGYNTVTEILAARRRAVLVPRIAPRREQWIRASLLAEQGLVHLLPSDELTPERLAAAVAGALDERSQPGAESADAESRVALDGTARTVAAIRSLFDEDACILSGAAGTSR